MCIARGLAPFLALAGRHVYRCVIYPSDQSPSGAFAPAERNIYSRWTVQFIRDSDIFRLLHNPNLLYRLIAD